MLETSDQMLRSYPGALAGAVGGRWRERALDPVQFMPALGMLAANWEILEDVPAVQGTGQSVRAGQPNPFGMLQIADVMPLWAERYTPSGLSFYQQYCSFLHSIQLKGGDQAYARQVEALRNQVVVLQEQLTRQTSACLQAWDAYRTSMTQAQPAPYEQWYGQNWRASIEATRETLVAAQANLRKALQAWGGPDYQTIAGALNQASPLAPGTSGLLVGAGTLVQQYRISPAGGADSGGLAAWYRRAVAEAGPGVYPPPEPEVSFRLDLGRSDVDPPHSAYAGGGVLGAAESVLMSQLDRLLDGCSISFSIMRLAQFGPILPGSWFNSAIVAEYGDQIAPNSALGSKELYGRNGVFNLRTGTVWVAYGASVEIKAASFLTVQGIMLLLRQMAAGQFSPFPGFGWSQPQLGASAADQDLFGAEEGLTIRLADRSGTPRIVGIEPVNLQP